MTKIILMKELKTKEEIDNWIKDKVVKEVKYKEGYSNIDIYFTDDTYISICGEDCFDFMVEIQGEIKEV